MRRSFWGWVARGMSLVLAIHVPIFVGFGLKSPDINVGLFLIMTGGVCAMLSVMGWIFQDEV